MSLDMVLQSFLEDNAWKIMIESFILDLFHNLSNLHEMLILLVDSLALIELVFKTQDDLNLLIIVCSIDVGNF